MVKLSISPATVRTFPYTGYLGLTPLKVEGCVCTALFPDEKPMLASSITVSVRCYESRLGRVSALQTKLIVDHTEELWSKLDGQEYTEIADLELPFRMVFPPDFGGRSTMSFPDYRVFWRIEAVLHHIPIVGVGCRQIKHYSLPWVRYDLPPLLAHLPTPSFVQFDSQTTKSRTPVIRYSVETPHNPVGPLDLVSVKIRLFPMDPSVSIRSASMIVERRIHFLGTSAPPSPSGSIPPPLPPTESELTLYDPEKFRPTNSSAPTSTSRPPSPILSPLNDKSVDFHPPHTHLTPPYPESYLKVSTAVVADVEPSGRFAQDSDGIWTQTLTFQWPAAKSRSRWSIGETSQTDIASLKFFARVKIIVSSFSGTESIELSEQEITAIATNAAERELAVCVHKGMQDVTSGAGKARSKSKSKSPRRRKRQHTHDPMPVSSICSESTIRLDPDSMTPHASPSPGSSSSKRSPSQRPHTSDGSSDERHSFVYVAACASDGEQRSHEKPSRKRSADVANADSIPNTEAGSSRMAETESPRRGRSIRGFPRNSTDTAICSTESAPMEEIVVNGTRSSATPSEHVGAWEAELVRVERQSRRRSAEMWGFAHKLKQMMGDRFAARMPIPAHNER